VTPRSAKVSRINRACLLLLAPVLMGQTFPHTQSGPFYRHIITPTVLVPTGCSITIGRAAPEQTRIIIESTSPAIPFVLTCSSPRAGVTVSSRTTGSITMDFSAETPPNAALSGGSYKFPPGALRTRASATAVYTPGVSVAPTSTYSAELGVTHGNRATGGSCDTQTDRKSGPKGAINVAMPAACDHEFVNASSITPPHGFGTP